MEQEKQAFFPKLISILLIAMGIFLGFYAFFANATTRTLPGGATWNNKNYLTGLFRDNAPTTGDIITALYGSGAEATAYTKNRSSNVCDPAAMVVDYIYPGPDTIPQSLIHNTIYVLASGNYVLSQGITTDTSCVAIIGNGNVKLYSSGYLDAMIWMDVQPNAIFDNIDIDGTNNGLGVNHTPNNYGIKYQGGTHSHTINNIKAHHNNFGIYYSDATRDTISNSQIYNNSYGIVFDGASYNNVNTSQIYNNSEGIYLENISNYNTIADAHIYNNDNGINISSGHNTNNNIHTSQIHNNQDKGIYLNSGSSNSIVDSQIYNNDNGIYLDNSTNNNINNAIIYNNNGNGILFNNSSYNSINNSQIYNSQNGIYLNSSPNNIINNSQVHNNNNGIPLFTNSNNNILHKVESYNNNFGIWISNSTNTRYYDTLLLFGNGTNIVGPGTAIISGSNSDITGSMLSLNDGVLSTGGTMDCSRITNPTTGGIYLQTGDLCTSTGQVVSWIGNTANNYRYGSNVLAQKRPAHRSGGTIALYGILGSDYDTGRYIGQYGPIGGTFNINNNTGITYTTNVTFYNTVTGGSSVTVTDLEHWEFMSESYGPSFSYLLYGGTTGLKTIYADFSGTNGTFMAMDTIIYDIPDTTPNQFNFTAMTGVELNTLYTSNVITITGITPGFFTGVSINTGSLFKNGININQSGTGGNGDQFYITLQSSDTYYTKTISTINIGGVTGNFEIETIMDTPIPPSGGGMVRENNNFIDSTFWSQSPTSGDIIIALYGINTGDETAYTQNRFNNNCNPAYINLVYKDPGTNTLPQQLSNNTIYILNSGNYTISYVNGLWMSGCTAIVGSGNVTIYSTGTLNSYAMIYASGRQNNIIDNIMIDGLSNGSGGTHTKNNHGIYLEHSSGNSINNSQFYNNGSSLSLYNSSNNSISNSQAYNNTYYGIYIGNSSNNSISYSQAYNNNSAGIYLYNCSNNSISYSQSYNNINDGIYLSTNSNNNNINNSQTYNNTSAGIHLVSSSNNNSINNSQAYNNMSYGIYLVASSSNNSINNSQSYNNPYGIYLQSSSNNNSINNSQFYNNLYWIYITSSTGNIYYGTVSTFGNLMGGTNGHDNSLTGGLESDPLISTVSRNDGILNTTGTLSRDYITNPLNASGNYFLSRGSGFTSLRGTGTFTITQPIVYSYGSGTLTQIQPVYFTGTTLITGGSFDSTKYIGSDIVIKTGDLVGLSDNMNSNTISLTGVSTTTSQYSLFGDITSYIYGQSTNTATGVVLLGGSGVKTIITQLYSGTNFATHFAKTGYLNTTLPDSTLPTISTGYIYSGSTGYTTPNYYYKGTVDIKADVSDNIGISGTTCMYTTGTSRASALYSGTTTTGYCYVTGIVGSATLNITFKVQDTSSNIVTGAEKTYIYDSTSPIFTFSNNSGYECITGTLNITSANDTGIGLHATPYSFDGITWHITTGVTIPTQSTTGIITKTGYVRDILTNTLSITATYTFLNTGVTANNFTGHASVGSTPRTANRKALSSANEGSCGSGSITYSGILTQGTKGTCTQVGSTGISYTPNTNQTGSDICVIQIKDDENSTGNITITWAGIDTTTPDIISPTVATGYIYSGSTGYTTPNYYYKGTVDIKADVSDNIGINGTTCMYTTGTSRASALYSGTTTTGYCYVTGIVGSATLNITFKVQDTSSNIATGTEKTYIYDSTSPTFTFSNNSGYECITGTLNITSANDTGIGLHATPYSFDGITWHITTGVTIPTQSTTGIITKTGYVRDILTNTLSITATYTFLNTGVTANNFTGHASVGSTPRTADRKALSSANEGACGSGNITYSGILTQGTKGTCSVIGNTITYTPFTNQTGGDTCIIQIKDNENSTASITTLWTGINTIGIALIRDNHNFLTSGFWNQNPTSGDIITALYGSGNSGTAYTTTWSGYTFNSCLSGGMNVVSTGILPETLSGHTIYVIPSGTYNLTASHIIMNDCTALVSSGTVVLSGEIFITNKTNIIIDNIGVTNNSYGSYGLLIHDLHNFSIHGARIYNSSYGISFTFSSYGNITNTSIYNNSLDGLSLNNSTHILVDTIYTYRNNLDGINLVSSSGNTFSGIISSGNNRYGIYTYSGDSNNISYSSIYQNAGGGIISLYENNSTFNHIETYNNTGNGMTIQYNSGMLIQNSLFLNNTNDGIDMNHSNTNIISGCIISGSDIGINIDVSNTNTISNSFYYTTSINNPFAIRMNNTTGNTIYNFSGQRDIYEWNSTGLFQYTTYDIATQTNNYINLGSYSTFITLTGNTLPVSTTFPIYFDQLDLDYGALYGLTGLTVGGDTWDGKLYSPVAITAGTKMAQSGETGTTLLQNIGDTIEIVSGNSYLTMNSGTGILGIYLPSRSTGQYIRILKSVDGSTWTSNSPTSGCILNSSKLCAFVTTGALKLFAFGTPAFSFTGTTQAGNTITSGGYYTTGISIIFTGDGISGHTLNGSPYTGGTLITGDGQYIFTLSNTLGNSTGITFTIDTTKPSVTGTAPISGANINTTSNVGFTWTGLDANMSGYALYITGTQQQTISTGGMTTTVTLTNGNYTRYVIATDRAGNTGISIATPFTVAAPFLPVMTMLTGNIQSNTTGSYTKDYVSLYIRTNKPANYSFTGNFTTPTPPFLGTNLNGGMTTGFTLATGDGQKNIYLNITDGSTTSGKTFTLYLDTTAPSIPTLITPTSGSAVNGPFTISWSAASDTGIGLSGYQYFVSTTGTIGTGIVSSGYTTSTSKSFADAEIGTSGTFYRYVKSIDRLGNSGTSARQPFSYTGTLDTVPNQFTLNTIIEALTDRIYGSNTITVTGLSTNTQVLASINRGVLYINGTMVGTTGYVQNGSTVKIELVSSNDYDTLVSSILTIGGVSATFRITTESETTTTTTTTTSTSLSATAKLQIVAIFEALQDIYVGVKQSEFLNSFMVMLQSKIDDLGTSTADKNTRYALQYMYDLVDNYRGNIGTSGDITNISDIVNGVYTAPNGKKYTITYNSTIKQFTSPNFLTPKYFVTRDSFKYVIDINNPAGSSYLNAKAIKARRGKIRIDGTWQTSPYTAPNRKVFYFFKTMEGQYSSYTFTVEKYFDSLDAVKEFIHNSNNK